jgi:hypothetical protein
MGKHVGENGPRMFCIPTPGPEREKGIGLLYQIIHHDGQTHR